jgi:hypothetical protein
MSRAEGFRFHAKAEVSAHLGLVNPRHCARGLHELGQWPETVPGPIWLLEETT